MYPMDRFAVFLARVITWVDAICSDKKALHAG